VNVVPVTTEGNVVLIRQFRHGIQDVTMEIPGGMMNEGEMPEAAAARELREETGYVAEKIRLLARVMPNPAVQNNFLYLFVAEGCRNTGKTQLDAFECIDVSEHPLEAIPELIHNGTISHCMVISAFAFMGLVPKVIELK
jgi:8-oxo-dGTP pyrophosphatase MutT (NUDIX family)